jgi:hypothetical protein
VNAAEIVSFDASLIGLDESKQARKLISPVKT